MSIYASAGTQYAAALQFSETLPYRACGGRDRENKNNGPPPPQPMGLQVPYGIYTKWFERTWFSKCTHTIWYTHHIMYALLNTCSDFHDLEPIYNSADVNRENFFFIVFG